MNIKSLYSGFSMCILRDSPGFAIYFTNYEFLKHYFLLQFIIWLLI